MDALFKVRNKEIALYHVQYLCSFCFYEQWLAQVFHLVSYMIGFSQLNVLLIGSHKMLPLCILANISFSHHSLT